MPIPNLHGLSDAEILDVQQLGFPEEMVFVIENDNTLFSNVDDESDLDELFPNSVFE